ncbi:MAG: hypothetical protein IPJ65_23615 [Archangiaceae bacterium]|nr:hypothetical protein [Archangiaceae bacterium]
MTVSRARPPAVSPHPGKTVHSNARVVRGTPGDDVIYGGEASQKIIGGGGNDVIIGGGGGDRILGGDGDDRLVGGAGGDQVRGGKGNDRLDGGRGNDTLRGDADHDRLAGGIGDDHLLGGAGHDGATGGMGIDVLRGGAGDDVQRGDAGPDFVDGGRGRDTVSYVTQSGAGYDPKNPHSGVQVVRGKAPAWSPSYEGVRYPDSSYGGSRAQGGSGVDGLKGNENVIGSAKDDRFEGDYHAVDGGPGRDALKGKAKTKISVNDPSGPPEQTRTGAVVNVSRSRLSGGTSISVEGGSTRDQLTVRRVGDQVFITDSSGVTAHGPGEVKGKTYRLTVKGPIDAVQLEGNGGGDRLKVAGFGADVPVTLSGGAGNDHLIGGRGNDVLNDGEGDDVLEGRGGDDGLTNGAGRDRLKGGAGSDLLVSSSIDAGDTLDGGAGADNVSFAQVGHDFAVRAQVGGTAQRLGGDGKPRGPVAHLSASVEDLEGTEEGDVLVGDSRENHLLGRGGADVLAGRGGDDLLEARDRDRDRRLDGGRGHDRAQLDREDAPAVRNVEKRR